MEKVRARIGGHDVGDGCPLLLIAGPCVIESRRQCLALAGRLARLARAEGIPLVFKASYDKANRSSHASYRGPGLVCGLEILAEVRERYGVPVLTEVHGEAEVPLAARVADIYDRINDLIEADFKIGPGDALVYINGERCRSNRTKLRDNDEVWLLSPASGG